MAYFKTYELNSGTLEIFKSCFGNNGSPKRSENIIWQFLNNPTKRSLVEMYVDKENQTTAGIYAISYVKFKVGNKVVLGAQSLDTLTDKDYRGLGLFYRMANSVMIRAKTENVSLVYGFPNGNSFPVFRKLLKWQSLDPLPFLIKPLRTKYFTNRINFFRFLKNINLSFSRYREDSNYTLLDKFSFPKEVDLIWKRFSRDITVSVVRDREYLNWRYLDKPNESYQIVHCYNNNDNSYKGFIVFTVKEKHDGRIGYIMEMMFDLDYPKVGKLLLDYAVQNIRESGADCILAWCMEHSPTYKHFKKMFFLTMPEKSRPIELHFATKTLNGELSQEIHARKNWYISYSDSDTV